MAVDWNDFKETIAKYQSFVLVSHIRPDCDALGSELGMACVLRAIGKDVRIINAHDTPPALQFLDPAGDIEVLKRSLCLRTPKSISRDINGPKSILLLSELGKGVGEERSREQYFS